ncbi:unnamed protein product [Pleuronectes platessa]|uniref:Uncharacterized protein n=1 Tax=Pleuronectes platessa TaxID=8262 RepID=A0A9N7YVE9_PLEPL|nr:unnamed protein product [Pleuronectes platessa]
MLTFVNISKARERDLKKEMEAMKTKMNEKVQENISLTTELHLHQLESQKVECDLKVKCAALKEKLNRSLRKEERSQQEKEYLIEGLARRKNRISDLEKEKQSLLLQIPKPQVYESATFTKYLNKCECHKGEATTTGEREKKEKKDAEKQEKKRQLEREKEEKMEKIEMKKQEKKKQLDREKKEKMESEELKKREKKEKIEQLAREQKEKIEMEKQEKKSQLEREKEEKEEVGSRRGREWYPCFLFEIRS